MIRCFLAEITLKDNTESPNCVRNIATECAAPIIAQDMFSGTMMNTACFILRIQTNLKEKSFSAQKALTDVTLFPKSLIFPAENILMRSLIGFALNPYRFMLILSKNNLAKPHGNLTFSEQDGFFW